MSTRTADWPQGYGHQPFGEVTSTLDLARAHAGHLTGPLWITATAQTASRGRRGRPWVAPVGNFYGTLVLPCADPARAALRSFVAALTLRDALRRVMGQGPDLALKWPNDVLLNKGKVAGILLESLTDGGRMSGIAIGIGVNLVAAPALDQVEPGATYPVSVKGESGADVTPEAFLAELAPAFARYEAQLTTQGFAPIRAAWLDAAARLGETVTARLPQDEVTGRFETIDETGYLILQTAHGLRRIAAADVYF
ncbi:biotin--[acetyl-CoA-carboxylase] ligase [Thalassorhabdomicrobium marinisediminis]|uniref:biotin--[acetyl-CoA-carboxylase] ligase n=1 Tax=Thalassorhabdomicrobium marinisediminis TaxID=2170577 RepID=UPI00248F8ACD|nr:biotin--[acetyl-CoA-carboxylase] ligase [Thalassorhabdomicrobium marinisediminis]